MNKKSKDLRKLDHEVELLTILMEECGEVIQEASKIIRFGADPKNLAKEIGDLICMIEILHEQGYFDEEDADEYRNNKREKLAFYSNLKL